MRMYTPKLRGFRSLFSIFLLTLAVGLSYFTTVYADSLYIGDSGDNSVKRFDAETGAYMGDFVTPGSGGLNGATGLIFTGDKLYVNNANFGVFTANGSILRYQKDNGNFFDTLVSDSALHAVYAPRGLIRGPGRTLYVANFTSDDTGPFKPGDIRQFDAANGDFIGNFNLDNTITSFPASSFFPRGLVQGPDGLIYVSVTGDLFSGDRITGKILRFDPKTGNFVDVFASNLDSSTSCARHLHRPEGLVFGPDKRLYVTSFRADPTDTDKILIFNKNGQCQDQIDLYSVQNHDPRAFAEAIMFGPKGRLFVPINNSGEVRRYNLKTRTFDRLIPPGGPLQVPWYLTFGETNPRTLGYDE